MYKVIIKKVKKIGLQQYEISNFAKKGYQSKHNKLYWTSYPYIGIGAGAHSFFYENKKIIRSIKQKKLSRYLNDENIEIKTYLDRKDFIFDKFYSEMRKLYINHNDFYKETGLDIYTLFKENFSNNYYSKFLNIDNNYIRFTEKGIINSDTIFDKFFDLIY